MFYGNIGCPLIWTVNPNRNYVEGGRHFLSVEEDDDGIYPWGYFRFIISCQYAPVLPLTEDGNGRLAEMDCQSQCLVLAWDIAERPKTPLLVAWNPEDGQAAFLINKASFGELFKMIQFQSGSVYVTTTFVGMGPKKPTVEFEKIQGR